MSAPDERLVRTLSHCPQAIRDSVVSNATVTEWKFPSLRRGRPLPLGKLDKIPLELLHGCMVHLDLKTLLHLSRVSRRGLAVVESLLPLKKFTQAAGDVLTILAQARILRLHTLATLCAALYSEQCKSCGAYGCLLHLLLAERCCLLCLKVNQSLWVMSIPAAKECFNLSKRQLRKLPFMWSIPGRYGLPNVKSRLRSVRLTSVRVAKQMAVRKYKSFEAFERKHSLDPNNFEELKFASLNWYRHAPLQPLSQDPLTIYDLDVRPSDYYCGMGVMHFPSLSTGDAEQGHWCKQCEVNYNMYALDKMESDEVERLVPQGCNTKSYLFRLQLRAWSRAGFIEHVRLCHDGHSS